MSRFNEDQYRQQVAPLNTSLIDSVVYTSAQARELALQTQSLWSQLSTNRWATAWPQVVNHAPFRDTTTEDTFEKLLVGHPTTANDQADFEVPWLMALNTDVLNVHVIYAFEPSNLIPLVRIVVDEMITAVAAVTSPQYPLFLVGSTPPPVSQFQLIEDTPWRLYGVKYRVSPNIPSDRLLQVKFDVAWSALESGASSTANVKDRKIRIYALRMWDEPEF